jgi:hypothetical protein
LSAVWCTHNSKISFVSESSDVVLLELDAGYCTARKVGDTASLEDQTLVTTRDWRRKMVHEPAFSTDLGKVHDTRLGWCCSTMDPLVNAVESSFAFFSRSRQKIFVVKQQEIEQDDHQVFAWMAWRVILSPNEWAGPGNVFTNLVESKNAVLSVREDHHFSDKNTRALDFALVAAKAQAFSDGIPQTCSIFGRVSATLRIHFEPVIASSKIDVYLAVFSIILSLQ